jgi:hypothetical protein
MNRDGWQAFIPLNAFQVTGRGVYEQIEAPSPSKVGFRGFARRGLARA